MSSKEQLRGIFIEEANEIIEKLDGDIIRYEEDPSNKELLNELFRGVHTLKGNANAFGFTRLGGFVHHFEDLLDFYRKAGVETEKGTVDLFLSAVDIIKETMSIEVSGSDGLPDSYDEVLNNIIATIDEKEGRKGAPVAAPVATAPMVDLASEFNDDMESDCEQSFDKQLSSKIQDAKAQLDDGQKLYKVDFTFDTDSYHRGFDHVTFLKNFSEIGKITHTFWNLQDVAPLQKFNPLESAIQKVTVLLLTYESSEKIEDICEFLFDNEYKVIQILKEAKAPEPTVVAHAAPVVGKEADRPDEVAIISPKAPEPAPNEIIHPNRRTEDRDATAAQKSYIKIDTGKLDELFDSVGELVIAQNFIAQNELVKNIEDENIRRTVETLTKITKLIQDRVMSLRMVAIRDTFEKMKRVVRDTAKKTNKEIKLAIYGEETEIDKTMIDSLSDPLVHIIRNAIDHGIEDSAETRAAAGKEPDGNVTLRAFHKSGSIIISISDDGRGISKEKVFKKAVERGLITGSEPLTDSDIFALIMQPGFSTAAVISDVSGRGVGLDVVKTSIEKLRGKIEIASEEGKGSTFSIILPLTLAIIDGMLVKSGPEIFIIPTLTVVESFRPSKEIVHFLKGRGEFVNLRDQHIPVIRLNDVLELGGERPPIWDSTLVCIESDKGRYAILVDELLGRQQVVIKTLGKSMANIREVSGGAILGNGDIALILNVEGLISGVSLEGAK